MKFMKIGGFQLKRDFKENPEIIVSKRKIVNTFTDCLNKAEIFNEKIPYLVIHRTEREGLGSRLEIDLTFKEDIKGICTSENEDDANKKLTQYIIKKLNTISNFEFSLNGKWYIDVLDKTNIEHYKSFSVIRNFYMFNMWYEEHQPITKNCTLTISIDNPYPAFEILGK